MLDGYFRNAAWLCYDFVHEHAGWEGVVHMCQQQRKGHTQQTEAASLPRDL